VEGYKEDNLERCLLEFQKLDFNNVSLSHNTVFLFDISLNLLLTEETSGFIKRHIIDLFSAICKSQSIALINQTLFDSCLHYMD